MRKPKPQSTFSAQGAGCHRHVTASANLILNLICAAMALVTASDGAHAGEIVITVAGPASGPQSDRTQSMLTGARAAADAVNRNGGIKGALVRIDSADDGCAIDKTKATAATLARQKADLVIGHPCAASANAAAKAYAETNTLFIAIGSRHHTFERTKTATTIFRLSGRDDDQGAEAAQELARRYQGKTLAIIHDRTSASIEIADDAAAALKKLGAPAPITATAIGGDKDFPMLTAKIKPAAAVFYIGYPLEAGMLFAQWRKAGGTGDFLMSASAGTDEFEQTFGASAAGISVLRPRFGLTPESADDTRGVETRINAAGSALANAAVAAYAAAANTAESVNTGEVARELAARAYATANGVVKFDSTGNADRPSYDIYKWTGETWLGAKTSPPDP